MVFIHRDQYLLYFSWIFFSKLCFYGCCAPNLARPSRCEVFFYCVLLCDFRCCQLLLCEPVRQKKKKQGKETTKRTRKKRKEEKRKRQRWTLGNETKRNWHGSCACVFSSSLLCASPVVYPPTPHRPIPPSNTLAIYAFLFRLPNINNRPTNGWTMQTTRKCEMLHSTIRPRPQSMAWMMAQTQNPKPKPKTEYWIVNSEYWILNTEYWKLKTQN